MNTKLTILSFGLILLASVQVKSQEPVHSSISISIKSAHSNPEHDVLKQELLEKVTSNVQNICNATASTYRLLIDKEKDELNAKVDFDGDESLNGMLLENLNNFVTSCNQFATQEGYNVEFCLDSQTDTINIHILCKELEPQLTYWERLKNGVNSTGQVIVGKTKQAGHYIKEIGKTGAEKVSHAAHVTTEKVSTVAHQVKDSAKHGIHTVAEKISEVTE